MGSRTVTMAISTHCRWPCGNSATMRSAMGKSCKRSNAAMTILSARGAAWPKRAASQMFSRTLRPSKTSGHLVLDADAQPGDLVRLGAADIPALEQDLAGGRPKLAGQHLEECALAGAIGSDEATQLATPELEVDAGDGPHTAEAAARVAGLEDDTSSLMPPAARTSARAHRQIEGRDSAADPG